MTCLACGAIHADDREVTLHDGRVVSSYSEEWRHETEALSVLALKTKPERWNYMGAVQDRRGKEAADKLRATVHVIWNARLAQRRATG